MNNASKRLVQQDGITSDPTSAAYSTANRVDPAESEFDFGNRSWHDRVELIRARELPCAWLLAGLPVFTVLFFFFMCVSLPDDLSFLPQGRLRTDTYASILKNCVQLMTALLVIAFCIWWAQQSSTQTRANGYRHGSRPTRNAHRSTVAEQPDSSNAIRAQDEATRHRVM